MPGPRRFPSANLNSVLRRDETVRQQGARRIATRLARIRSEGTPTLADFRHALRDVARYCIHGVDRNPMAVELTKVALWIETVDPGLPLGFFDAQIRCGDSLVGVFELKVLEDGIPDGAYKPLTGDDKETAKYYLRANRDVKKGQSTFDFETGKAALPAMNPVADDFAGFRALPEETLDQINTKATRFRKLLEKQGLVSAAAAADLYVAAFLLPKTGGAPSGAAAHTVPTTEEVWSTLGQGTNQQSMKGAQDAASDVRAFHWPLEFPDIMARGGFDVVLGNPPWERIKLQEQEFFATRSPEIAEALNKAARARLIKALATAPDGSAESALYAAFIAAKRESEAVSQFVRIPDDEGGRFALTGRGDVNTYTLFAELFANLTRDRAGVIVPTGIATDATTAEFFAALVEESRIAQLVDFENSAPLFVSVHRSYKFCLLTLGRNEGAARFAFFLTDPAQLAEPERNFTLSPGQIAAINPNTRTAPVFRSRTDAELTAKIYANAPVLIDESKGPEGNPWGVRFARLFDMSNDSGLFRTAKQLAEAGFVREGTDWVPSGIRPQQESLEVDGADAGSLLLEGGGSGTQRYVPLYEAKLTWHFDHRASSYLTRGGNRGNRVLPPTTKAEHVDTSFEIEPFYWVSNEEVSTRLAERARDRNFLFGWRDVTTAIAERTMVPCLIPKCGAGDTFLLAFTERPPQLLVCMYANWASLTFDYATRQKIAYVHLKYNIVKQLPTIKSAFYTEPRLDFVVPRVLELTYTSHAMTLFARDLDYDGPPFFGMRSAALTCAPNSMPSTPALMGSPATNCGTYWILPM